VRALNEGLATAMGEYVARMDADDIAFPGRFERQVAFLQGHPDVAVVGTFADTIDEAGLALGSIKPLCRAVTDIDVKWRLLFGNALVHSTVMMRRRNVLAAGNYDVTCEPSEDYDLWSRLGQRHQVVNIPEIHLKYRVHASSVSFVNSPDQSMQSRKISGKNLAQLGIPLAPQELSTLERAYGGGCDFTAEDVIVAASLIPDVYRAFVCKYGISAEGMQSIREWVEMQVMRGTRNCASLIMAQPLSTPLHIAYLKPWRWCSRSNHFLVSRVLKSLSTRVAGALLPGS
jgi:glycosyltransferase involved in cell wall biosynthesis